MKKLGLLAAASFALAAFPQMALSKPSVLKIQPEGSQLVTMESGAQVVTSQMAGSIVVMRTPEPFDGKRTRIFFTFVNNGQYPVNVGPENVTSKQVAVISYDQLIAEQKRSEGVDKFIAALGAVGKSLSATDAGRETTVTSYSGYANCGIGCGGTYSGSAVSRTYSPYAAQQARAQVAAENSAAASEMHSSHASERNAIARNLQTTTVNPGHYITGMLTFEVPTAVRRSKKAVPISLAIRIGSDVHMLRGFAGPLGAPPPAPSSIAVGQVTQPLVSNIVPRTAPVLSATTGNVFEDSYAYGYRLWEAKSYPQARATLEETLTRFPNHKRASYARYLLGRAWFDDKKPATAIKVFYDNYKADPRGDRAPDSLFFLGCGLNDMGKAAEAQEAFRELNRSYQAEVSGRLAPLLAEGCERRGLSKITNPARMLNGGDLINGPDYPSGSRSRGEEGISAFELTLKNGRPASCKITSSSGFEELDEATCRLATERAVFDMSTLPNGDWSTYSDRVRWQIGPSEPRANSGNLAASQSISRIDPNKIRCQYSDGLVRFVNAGNPCIQAATVPAQQANADLSATISKAILEGRCEDAKTVALTSSRLDLADLAVRLCKPATKR